MTALRLTPLFALGNLRAWRMIERNLLVYRHGWVVLLSGFFEPLFYLLSIGFGLGRLVGDVAGPGGAPIPYALFVAPALLAASSMNGAITESTFNFFFKLNYDKTFASILTTPMSPADISLGELAWALMRGALYSVGFLGVMIVFGLVRSPLILLTLPGSLLIGFAFASIGMAATSYMRTWQDFDLIQLVILPMFLFSGTFFPLDAVPDGVRLLVQLTPLYHGVEMLRALAVGVVGPEILVHVAYLAVMGVIGIAVVSRRLDKLLLK
jgi:lipooligosaccharide transport system permease protein